MLTFAEAVVGVDVLAGVLERRGVVAGIVYYDSKIKGFGTRLGNIPEQSVMSAVFGDCTPLDSWLAYFTLPLRMN